MSDYLEKRRTIAEIRKITAETESLKRPLSKPSSWLPFFIAAASLLTAIGQYQSISVERERSALAIERKVFDVTKQYDEKLKDLSALQSELESLEQKFGTLKELSEVVSSLSSSVAKARDDHQKGSITEDEFKSILVELMLGFEKTAVKYRGESVMISTQTHTQIIKEIVSECKKQGLSLPSQIAYVIATISWETNSSFQPIREAYWLSERWRKINLRYYPYYGRGYIGITWKSNYEKYGKLLNIDLVGEPDLAMKPEVALFIAVHGIRTGLFTGRKLSEFINDDDTDYINARKAINGIDNADTIAKLAERIEKDILSGEFD